MDNIIQKVRKLLALATSSNEHEAALAAQRAQELILKHHVDMAAVQAAGQAVEVEPIERDELGCDDHKGGKIPHWHVSLAGALERPFMTKVYYVPGYQIYLVGRKTDREAFRYTWMYLRREIERLGDTAWNKTKRAWLDNGDDLSVAHPGHGRTWKRGFYHGAADTVRVRLRDATNELAAHKETAIVLANRFEEADKWIRDRAKLASKRVRPPTTGYRDGQQAGWSLNLNTKGSVGPALPEPAKRIKGEG